MAFRLPSASTAPANASLSEIKTVGSYLKASQERQAELIRGIG